MQATTHAIDFIQKTRWEDLPAGVQGQARRCLMDALGALLAGVRTPVARLMADYAREQHAGQQATLFAGGRAALVGAALANGFAANALDIDDGYRPIKGHPAACVLPVLLAAAEGAGQPVSGRELLAVWVVGYEIAIRAGLIRHASHTTYHSSGSWGAIAGAAVAGRLLDLDAATLCEALGVAEYHAPIAPMMKGIDRPCMGKDSTAWGAMVGMASTLMAQRGFTGVLPLFDDAPQPEWVAGLGRQYEILNLYFKPYACCRWAQPAIAGALGIARQQRLEPAQIARIVVRTFESSTRLSREHPQNTEEAQYNLSFPVAAALIDGELGPRQVLPPRLFDPELLALADRVEALVEPAYEALFPARACAEVEVYALDGTRYASGMVEARWQPPAGPTDAELRAKFLWLMEPLLGSAGAADLLEQVDRLEEADDVRGLIAGWALRD